MPRLKISPLRTATRAALLLGLLLILFAFVWWLGFHPTPWYRSPATATLLAVGLLLEALGVAANLRWIWRAVVSRRGLMVANVALMTLAAGVILVFVNLIGLRHYARWDMTAVRKHSLDERTVNVLSGLRGELKITAVFHGDEDTLSSRYPDQVSDLLKCFAAQSSLVRYDIINDIRQPDRARLFADHIGLPLEPNSIVFQYGGRTRVVPREDLLLLPKLKPGEAGDTPPKFFGEDAFASAIVALCDPTPVRVYFAIGHGERSPADSSNDGMERLAQRLRRENCAVETIDLFAAPDKLLTPDQAANVLILAGPTTGYTGPALDAIRAYLQQPGAPAILVMVEPQPRGGNLGGLKGLLADYNIAVRDDVVAEGPHSLLDATTGRSYRAGATRQIKTTDFVPHPITERLETLGVVFPFAAAIDAVRTPQAKVAAGPVHEAKLLLRAPADTWGETVFNDSNPRAGRFDRGEDLAGPVPLGAAMQTHLPEGASATTSAAPRIVAFASADFAANKDFAAAPGNEALVANAVSWLAHRETRMGIRPPEDDSRPVAAKPKADVVTFMITVVGLPLLAFLTGAVVWWRRQR